MKQKLTFSLCLVLASWFYMGQAQSFDSLKRSRGKTQLYDIVEKVLAGHCAIDSCMDALQSGSLMEPFDGKTPLYLVLDYLATHPKAETVNAEVVLAVLLKRKDCNVNLRYDRLPPPLAYLLRTNHQFLNGRFDRNYISDYVWRLLLEAGASVNSYTADGETLMDFALATENEDLQTFLFQQGASLDKRNNRGEDVVYRIIAEGNANLLRQVLSQEGEKVNLQRLSTIPLDKVQRLEVCGLLAEHCSKSVKGYDELMSFRKLFPQHKHLVNEVYEALAAEEVGRVTDMLDLKKVAKKFPESQAVEQGKKNLYQQGWKRVEQHWVAARQAANRRVAYFEGSEVAESFRIFCQDNAYDPDGRLSVTLDLLSYYKVHNVLYSEPPTRYWEYSRPPQMINLRYLTLLKEVCTISKENTGDFKDFYAYAYGMLSSRYEKALSLYKSHEIECERAYAAYRTKRERLLSEIDALSPLQVYEQIRYQGEWSRGRFFDTDDDYTDRQEIYFKDDIQFTLYEEYKKYRSEKRWYYTSSSLTRYTDHMEAIVNGYKEMRKKKIVEEYPLR